MLTAPEVVNCAECVKYVHKVSDKGVPYQVVTTKDGKSYPRPKGTGLPCWKCPKGPEPFVKEMSAKNLRAYHYYRMCIMDATGLLPRDLIVVKNNALIRTIEEQIDRSRTDLTPLLALRGG